MKIRILDEAEAEFADAIARYESIESGLGVHPVWGFDSRRK